MASSLLVLVSIVGLILAALALGGYFAIRAVERRTQPSSAVDDEAELATLPLGASASLAALDGQVAGSNDVDTSVLLDPIVEEIEEVLAEAFFRLADDEQDLLVSSYGLVGITPRRAGTAQPPQRMDEARLRAARLRFNREVEAVLERLLRQEERPPHVHRGAVREAHDLVCGEKIPA
jgi:hypothetical protein